MIALCLQHHAEADRGTFTTNHLHQMKSKIKVGLDVAGSFRWRRRKTLVVLGGNFFVNCSIIVGGNGEPLIWHSLDRAGMLLINVSVRDKTGKELFAIRDNEWIASRNLSDLDCATSAHRLKLSSKADKVGFDIHFRMHTADTFAATYWKVFTVGEELSRPEYNWKAMKGFHDFPREIADEILNYEIKPLFDRADGTSEALVCSIHGSISWPIVAKLSPLGTIAKRSQNGVAGSTWFGGKAIHLGDPALGEAIGYTIEHLEKPLAEAGLA